jgi:hypothetical protein
VNVFRIRVHYSNKSFCVPWSRKVYVKEGLWLAKDLMRGLQPVPEVGVTLMGTPIISSISIKEVGWDSGLKIM